MLKQSKTVMVATLLGGFALAGVGVAQAEEEPAAPKCIENEYMTVCVQHSERTYTTKDRKVTTKSTVKCSSSGKATTKVNVERSSSQDDTRVQEKTTMECSTSSSN